MREVGPASNDEMVLSFLRGEINSPRWGPHYMAVLNQIRTDRLSLIDNADLNDADATAFEQWSLARSEATDVMRLYFAGSQRTRHGGVCSLTLLTFKS